jgi:hypothetical protein
MQNRMLKKPAGGISLRRDALGCEHTLTFLQQRRSFDLVQCRNNRRENLAGNGDIVVYLPIIRL